MEVVKAHSGLLWHQTALTDPIGSFAALHFNYRNHNETKYQSSFYLRYFAYLVATFLG